MTSRVRHPILRLEVLGPTGRTTDHRVFCQLQRRSVRVETCVSCIHCDGIHDYPPAAPNQPGSAAGNQSGSGNQPGSAASAGADGGASTGRGAVSAVAVRATVDCTIPATPLSPADDVRGERTEVGTLLCLGTVVVSHSASIASALGILRSEDRRSVAIVDATNVLVGLVHETGFMSYRACGREEAVSVAMSTALALDERTPVRTALRLLAANHLREATVVTDEGVPLGVFRDVDGLRWISAAQRAGKADASVRRGGESPIDHESSTGVDSSSAGVDSSSTGVDSRTRVDARAHAPLIDEDRWPDRVSTRALRPDLDE